VPRRHKIVIADDHRLLLDTLVPLIAEEFDVVGTVGNGEALIEAVAARTPDLALVDIGMPIMGGLDAGRQIRRTHPAVKLVYMTMDQSLDLATQAFAIGAAGYLLKTCAASELVLALQIIASGGTYLTEAVAGGRVPDLLAPAEVGPTSRLSPREYSVLQLAVTGAPMKEIARQLGISPRTVAFHKYRGMAALGLRRNTELVAFALRHGMLRRQN
jgi:DNA-binding NarL/FixJ family response regulator